MQDMQANTTRTRRWAQTALLLLMGLYFMEILITGEIAFYINNRYNILAFIAGVIFLILGLVSLYTLLTEKPKLPANAEIDLLQNRRAQSHTGNRVASWAVLAILAIPLTLGILVPPKPLGASAIEKRGISTSLTNNSPVASFNTTEFSTPPEQRNILDWVRAFTASQNPESFNGQTADVIGFVYRDVRFAADTQFMVSRYTVSCCVADAFAIGLVVETDKSATLAQETWVHVRGKFTVKTFDDRPVPVLIADVIEQVPQPDRPYLFP